MKSKRNIKNVEVQGRTKPEITVRSAKKIAYSSVEWWSILSELIDNSLLLDREKRIDVLIKLKYSDDDQESFIEVRDSSIGIPESDILKIFDYGTSANDGKMLLSKMGMGLKGAIWGLGELDYLISKTENGNKSMVVAMHDSDTDVLEYQKIKPNTDELNNSQSGTIVRIKCVKDKLPNWNSEKDFNKFVSKLNNMYAHLLSDDRLTINISYENSVRNVRFSSRCKGSFPLMSNPQHMLDYTINLGFNEPIYLKDTKTPINGHEIKTKNTKVRITAWHKPTVQQVEKYFENTKDEIYNPTHYRNSLFCYGSSNNGITIMYKGKYLEFNVAAHQTRTENQGIIVEISDDSGLSFTAYKNNLQKNNNYNEMIEAVMAFLKENDFFVRSIAGTPAIKEDLIIQNFLEYLKYDSMYLENLGIVNFQQQVQLWKRTEVGETDILIKDINNSQKVTCVIEAKKDRCGGYEASQLWGYMAYHNCRRGILISGADEQPSFSTMINALKNFTNLTDVEVSSISTKTLKAGKFF